MRRICLLLGLGLYAAPAFAQAPTPLIIDQNRVDRTQPIAPPVRPRVETAIAPQIDVADDAAAVPIRGIRFEGTKVPAGVARAAERFVGQRARRATLEALAKAMADAYASSDVALYSVRVPQQDFADGIVRIGVSEGYIEGVAITGDVAGRKLGLIRAYAARLSREKPLTRAALERYLSLIRDLPGLTLDAQLLRGITPGGVKLVLDLKQRGHELAFGVDNRTTQSLGDIQGQATAKFYGALREGDETDIVLSAAGNLRSYRYGSIAHSTPLGADGTRLAASFGYLATRPHDSPLRGKAELASLTVSHPLIRSYKRNLTLSASLDGVDSDNAAFGALIAQEHTRAARVAAAFSAVGAHRVIGAAVTLSQGLDIFGARVVEPFAETGFTKLNARASYDRTLSQAIVVRLRASGQATRDRLPAVERFAAGGAEYGRAFDAAVLSADRGVAGSGELAWRPNVSKPLAASELYSFVDGAKVHFVRRGLAPAADYDLASAGAGIRLAYLERASLELEGARSIDRPYPGYDNDWRVSVGWRLSLKK